MNPTIVETRPAPGPWPASGGWHYDAPMQINIAIPYDEKQLRRTLKFIMKPQMKVVRLAGVVIAVLGLLLVALEPTSAMHYGVVVIGLLFVTVVGPLTLAKTVRLQSKVIRDGQHMTLDDEWLTMSFPLAESRLRWAGLDRVIDTPEVWYAMFGKMQAVTIPKNAMTEQQRAEFAAFLAARQLTAHQAV
jgi:hypothetical protein